MAYPLPLDTAYRSSGTESESLEVLIRASRLKKVMADKGKKSSMEIFAPNDKADYYSRITKYWSDKEDTAEILKIKTDVFGYETPLCLAFNEFNYLLKVDPDLLTKNIMGFKTYEDYKDDDWIYEMDIYDIPWVDEKP
ncbi:hypothetical protein Tco_0882755 [Tanacetum coccineum]